MALSGCISEDVEPEPEGAIRTGDFLPSFAVMMNDGGVLTTESLRGRPSCIVFFHTSCPDCQRELPLLDRLFRKYAENGEVAFVAISREETAASVAAFWAENGLALPYSAQHDRGVYNLFAAVTIPRIYISDKNLQVRSVFTDSEEVTEEVLDTAIRSLLP